MTISQNGWTVLWSEGSSYMHNWLIPSKHGSFELLLRRGAAGFVLCHYALWHSEQIEPVEGVGDDFGWSPRRISGSTEWSNHASATAQDLNASAHPSGTDTFGSLDEARIRARLSLYEGGIRWGGDYRTSIDQMHFEINQDGTTIKALANRLFPRTERGQRLIDANPGQERFFA